jgi:hypothetical protein
MLPARHVARSPGILVSTSLGVKAPRTLRRPGAVSLHPLGSKARRLRIVMASRIVGPLATRRPIPSTLRSQVDPGPRYYAAASPCPQGSKAPRRFGPAQASFARCPTARYTVRMRIITGDRDWDCPVLATLVVDRLVARYGRDNLVIVHGAAVCWGTLEAATRRQMTWGCTRCAEHSPACNPASNSN